MLTGQFLATNCEEHLAPVVSNNGTKSQIFEDLYANRLCFRTWRKHNWDQLTWRKARHSLEGRRDWVISWLWRSQAFGSIRAAAAGAGCLKFDQLSAFVPVGRCSSSFLPPAPAGNSAAKWSHHLTPPHSMLLIQHGKSRKNWAKNGLVWRISTKTVYRKGSSHFLCSSWDNNGKITLKWHLLGFLQGFLYQLLFDDSRETATSKALFSVHSREMRNVIVW